MAVSGLGQQYGINWQDISAKKIIFCEGYQAIHNPWFNYLPFQLAKGEILTLTAKQILPSTMSFIQGGRANIGLVRA
jgi:hypothetical protein